MPYLPDYKKPDVSYDPLEGTPGELNYAITIILQKHLDKLGGLSYTNINEVVGALECCKLEMYRRLAIPYEDKKIKENGDVYEDV